ncbi:MAG: nitroreductase family protein [Actinomycetia bacterium]|nr:nitroreductase family protein [Actinomycetes bacterium]
MDVYEAIFKRQSIRSYDNKKRISQEVIKKILEAAVQAPSAGNIQCWRFWVIRNQEIKERLSAAAYNQKFLEEAPVVIAVGADLQITGNGYGERGMSLYALQDTAAAIENILLAATSEGLGTCWVGAFSEEKAEKALSAGENMRIVALIPLGYIKEKREKPYKTDVMDLTKFIS